MVAALLSRNHVFRSLLATSSRMAVARCSYASRLRLAPLQGLEGEIGGSDYSNIRFSKFFEQTVQVNTSVAAPEVGGEADEDGEVEVGPVSAAPALRGGDRGRPPFVCWSYTAAAAAIDKSVR